MAPFIAALDFAPACANDNESMAAFLLTMRGQAAALAGVSLGANPYRPDTFEGSRWAEGWMAGILELDEQPHFTHSTARRKRVARLRTVASNVGLGEPSWMNRKAAARATGIDPAT
jgi:hypothetical protein